MPTSDMLRKARMYEQAHGARIPAGERPVYHLTPYVGWMNDPNGFSFYKGQYHMFYQYYPYDTRWGPMHWGHAVSSDLLHWTYLPAALAPDSDFDRDGCFSGSAGQLPDGRQLLLYTGVLRQPQPDGSWRDLQTQCVAIGDGVDYEKQPLNPVIGADSLPAGCSAYDFRDPKLWRNADGSYSCIVASRTEDGSGALLLYNSPNGLDWQYAAMPARCNNQYGRMWECPDMFRLDGMDVILTSPQDMLPQGLEFHSGNGTLCLLGQLDPASQTFVRQGVQAIDYGLDFYATQTLLAPDGRRIMTAWMQNWDTSNAAHPHRRWFGQLICPRELAVRDGRLIQNPVRELEALRSGYVHHGPAALRGEARLPGVQGRVLDMTVELSPLPGESYRCFTLRFACGDGYETRLTYRCESSTLKLDRSCAGSRRDFVHTRRCAVRQRGGALKLRLLLDRYSAEIFVNDGEQALSATLDTPQSAQGILFETDGAVALEVHKYALG